MAGWSDNDYKAISVPIGIELEVIGTELAKKKILIGLTLVGGDGLMTPPPENSRVKLCWVVVSIDG